MVIKDKAYFLKMSCLLSLIFFIPSILLYTFFILLCDPSRTTCIVGDWAYILFGVFIFPVLVLLASFFLVRKLIQKGYKKALISAFCTFSFCIGYFFVIGIFDLVHLLGFYLVYNLLFFLFINFFTSIDKHS